MKLKSKLLMPALMLGALTISSISACSSELGSDEKTKIVFWTNIYDPEDNPTGEVEMMDKIVAAFEDKYPNIDVEYKQSGQYADIHETIQSNIKNINNLPNMAVCYPDYVVNYLENGNIQVKYPGLAKAVTPGQACVLYLGEECLGCGFIKTVKKDATNLWYLQN